MSLSPPLPSSLLPSSSLLRLAKPLLPSVSSSSSMSSSNDPLRRKFPATESSSVEEESASSSEEEEKSSSQDASSSSSSSGSSQRSRWRSSPLIRDSSSSDQDWKSHSFASQCRGARAS
jgi:hypothetical protein